MRQKTRFYTHFDGLVPLEELTEHSTFASCDAPDRNPSYGISTRPV